MKKAHSEEEIIKAALQKDKDGVAAENNKVDVAVDLEDENEVTHTYVVTFQKNSNDWKAIQVSEISSL